MRIAVISAGLSEQSASTLLATRLQEAAADALAAQGVQVRADAFELKTLIPEIGQHYSMGFPGGRLSTALDAVREADAVVAVSPIFKASYSGLFKSFWDLVEDADMRGKPVALAATGGTARHSLAVEYAMRPLFSYLQADIVPTAVFAATDDFGSGNSLDARLARAGGELAQKMLGRTQSAPLPTTPPAQSTETRTPQVLAQPSAPSDAGEDLPATPERYDPELMDRTGTLPGSVHEEPAQEAPRKAAGLPPLKLVPFDQLLRG